MLAIKPRSFVKNGDGSPNGSRWGLRGTEDLGNGLKALFTLENGFSSVHRRAQPGQS